ncbi:UNVERIFIED_CONTAM: hypothetical protein FKN15_028485 [Acipenser sinensis]
MLKTRQCLLGIRTFLGVTSRIWGFFLYLLRKHLRTVVIDKHPVRFFVHKRPHVDFFLEVVSQWYELVVFTASMEIYGSAVADKLDNNREILKRRYYRQVIALCLCVQVCVCVNMDIIKRVLSMKQSYTDPNP